MSLRTMKRGDREPAFPIAIDVDGSAPDLTGKTVRFIMKNVATGERKVDAAPTIFDQTVEATRGRGEYAWPNDADTDTAGLYLVEVEVTSSDGKRRTFPGSNEWDEKVYLRIDEDC